LGGWWGGWGGGGGWVGWEELDVEKRIKYRSPMHGLSALIKSWLQEKFEELTRIIRTEAGEKKTTEDSSMRRGPPLNSAKGGEGIPISLEQKGQS